MSRKRVATSPEGTKAIGQRLTAIRKARGLTQIDVAHKLRITQTLISKYERGDLLLHGELIVRFAETLDVSADDILGIERKRKVRLEPPGPAVDRNLARRFVQLQGLPRRDRDAIMRTLDAFLAARGGRAAA
ncbi:MAG: helix-turn-helix transcriptional regulator [Myxococcaceae bacterium]|nr:helix-turn-helix transcriptional regulator [Myxococcaceae bacterium]